MNKENNFAIKAIQVQHGPIPAFAYIIELCGKTLVFSGDTNGNGFENLRIPKSRYRNAFESASN